MSINKDRILNEFNKLISFDSPSFYEDEIAKYLYNKLIDLGLEVYMDKAIEKLTGRTTDIGNIYGYLKGNIDKEPILFSAHMDTVEPSKNKKAIITGNVVRANGSSVLGSDDVTGIVEILEMLEQIKENNLDHPDIEVIFFVAEEPFCKGSSVFDFSRVKSKKAYVFDLHGKVGIIAVSAPSIFTFNVSIHGKSAHAGFEIEKGISSIKIASNAISKINIGRIDKETTINIGTINGGVLKNIVPETTTIVGEVRSSNHSKGLALLNDVKKVFQDEANKLGGTIDFNYEENVFAYRIDKDEEVVKDYLKVIDKLGYGNVELVDTFGGSDNNNLNKHGIKGIVVANSMNDIHTTHEYFEIDELYKAANICLALATQK